MYNFKNSYRKFHGQKESIKEGIIECQEKKNKIFFKEVNTLNFLINFLKYFMAESAWQNK